MNSLRTNPEMRTLVAFGTRPEIIKLGPVCRALRERNGIELDVLWTGQHVELAVGLFDLFEIKVTHSGTDLRQEEGLAARFGRMTRQIEQALRRKRYDWIVVQGDTATAAAAAMAGFLNRVPVAHVEAGLRTENLHSPWPEEFNRRLITLAARLHFAPTAGARDNLLREGISADNIAVVGNTVVDALLHVREKVRSGYTPVEPEIAAIPADKKLVLATLHRRENIGPPLREVLCALSELGRDGDKVIALPVHLNPEVHTEVMAVLDGVENVRLLPPLQYTDFVYLLSRAWTVVSDSGGVQEEAPAFGLQILITRDTTERPEVLAAGFGRLVGCNRRAIVDGVRALTASSRPQRVLAENPFGRGDAARQIVRHLAAQADAVPARGALVAAA
jgi:UDP-N-acetylglucosamine 2-epimerase